MEYLLRVNGFRTESVIRVPEIDEQDDVAVIRWARKHQMIVVCFDLHNDHQTRLVWDPEIKLRGGRVIEIPEGPEQPAEMAAGKVLMYQPTWSAWFREHRAGVVRLNRHHPIFKTQDEIRPPTPRSEADWERYLRAFGRRTSRGGRPGRGGRSAFPPHTGKNLL
ncbi:MAG: hypothetical protein AMXMBFR23_27570 [Chloroflexota bacterium]